MTKIQNFNQSKFDYSDIKNWDLFEICLPAGRQGIWNLVFEVIV
jgi:hypothetical protein